MERASLNLTLHRINDVEADLEAAGRRILLDDGRKSEIALMRARLALARGDYDGARRHLDASAAQRDSIDLHAVRAQIASQTGEPDLAHQEIATAESMYHGKATEPRAWFHLLRGLVDLDHRDYDEALRHYRDADAAMPDYWLVQEHIAEIHALRGEHAQALAIYRPVVNQTGSPELMGALAGVLLEVGEHEEAAQLIKRAQAIFDARLEEFPEAAGGHALEFAIEFGDPARAVELAEANARLRPNGPALGLLAEAYLAADRRDDAAAAVARAGATGWVSPDLTDLEAEID